jgi:hypothetical protein
MPTQRELRSLVSFDRTNPAIDTTYFPHMLSDVYWSSSSVPGGSSALLDVYAWGINFTTGQEARYLKYGGGAYVRLVRTGI